MRWWGINYDIGTFYGAGSSAPDSCDGYDVDAHLGGDIGAIVDGLGCNSIQVYGDRFDRLIRAGELALDRGLDVWIQPRLVDATTTDHLEQIDGMARAVQSLSERRHGRVVFSVGVEVSLFLAGLVDGSTLTDRMASVFSATNVAERDAAVDDHLGAAVATARRHFDGPITYGAGPWETVDWGRFDLVGLDLYPRPITDNAIRAAIADAKRFDKPVVVTEYGCVTHTAAIDTYGADVIDWTSSPASLHPGVQRSESTQADGIAQQFNAITDAGASGAFCFTFLEARYRQQHGGDDLDAASFGVVRIPPDDPANWHRWVDKAAFGRLAELHHAMKTGE